MTDEYDDMAEQILRSEEIAELSEGKIPVKIGQFIFLFEEEQLPNWEEWDNETKAERVQDLLYETLEDQFKSLMTLSTPGEEPSDTAKLMMETAMEEAEEMGPEWMVQAIMQTEGFIRGLKDGSIEPPTEEQRKQVEAEFLEERKKDLN